MLATVSTTLEIAGLELDVEIEVSGEYADHGIGAFEFWGARGVHHDWGWEDIQLSSLFFEPGDIRTALRQRDFRPSRRRFQKIARRARRQIETVIEATAEQWVSDNANECIDALAAQNEPDDEDSRAGCRSRFAYAA